MYICVHIYIYYNVITLTRPAFLVPHRPQAEIRKPAQTRKTDTLTWTPWAPQNIGQLPLRDEWVKSPPDFLNSEKSKTIFYVLGLLVN